MSFSIIIKFFNIFSIMSVTFSIVLLLKIYFNFIMFEVSESLSLLLLNCHFFNIFFKNIM